MFRITKDFSVTPGFRFEDIQTNMTGVILNRTFPVSYKQDRTFPIFGTGLQYQLTENSQLYGNISQAYRPFLYANVTPADQLGVINPNLKDSRGYSVDLGYRGNAGTVLRYDLDAYYVYYGNRVGTLTETNASSQTYLYTTNIGNAVAKGVETYLSISLLRSFNGSSASDIQVFNALSYDHARYISGSISQGTTNISLVGNYAEGTPDWIERGGVTYLDRHISTTVQYSYVSKTFSDANNTAFNPTGASGLVPAYHVFDWAFNYSFLAKYHLLANINNLFNAKYFTRRINMYPGPGILPADGRTFSVGFGVKF